MLISVTAPILLGWLMLVGKEKGYFNGELGTAFLVVALVSMLFSVVIFSAQRISYQVSERVRSEERYKSLVSALTSVVWTTNPEGEFLTNQDSWQHFTGQKWEEYARLGWLNAIHASDRTEIIRQWSEKIKSQRTLALRRPNLEREPKNASLLFCPCRSHLR